MKQFFFIFTSCLILTNHGMFADEIACPESEDFTCTECTDEGRVVKFKCIQNYENSVVVDPSDFRPLNSRPNNYESSFYEMMTR